MPLQQYYTPQEVAEMFGMTRLTVYGWVKRGEIEAFSIGRKILIPKEGVQQFLERHRYEATAETTPSGVKIYTCQASDLYEGRGWGDDEETDEQEIDND